MQKQFFITALASTVLLFTGCSQNMQTEAKQVIPNQQPEKVDQEAAAKNTLISFFNHLSKNEFAEAVKLYSSDEADWETPNIYSSEEDGKDRAKILARFCEATGTCLKVEVLSSTKKSEGDYAFTVQFIQKDGSIMKFGPFNGVDNDPTPPETKFQYNVKKIDGVYKVMTSPLYAP